MSFQKKVWKDRLSENPTRRTLTPTDGTSSFDVDVTRNEGTIMQQGDAFSAENMNDLENRIEVGIGGGDENMAPKEEDMSSSANAYAVGDLLIGEGQLYRVISPISVGNSIVEDVNVEATTVSSEVKDIQSELTANGNRIYMDYQGGEYGYNTSPSRGADTFHPFKRNPIQYKKNWTNSSQSGSGTYPAVSVNITDYPDYQNITKNDILVVTTSIQSLCGINDSITRASAGISWNYNASTGIVTISNGGAVSGNAVGATGGYVAVLAH